MKNLIIIGARGFGREVYIWATLNADYRVKWDIKGFLDDDEKALDDLPYPVPILSSVEEYVIQSEDVFICALGSTEHKKKYAEIISNQGGEFINLIHPSVIITGYLNIGQGVIISANCMISTDCTIKDFVSIQPFSILGHDVKVGKWCHLGAYSFVGGKTVIQEGVTVHTRATIIPGLLIEGEAVIGVGSVVLKNVPSRVTVFGNPARIFKLG